ncbi:TPA_exp: Uncharacterized protein A8136_1423 [Trichophyton benhamiae CBS 112371]|nr:TPA_exp: Uncharacterized protein A8136_1423 [Trichophyton benhamiae CBS 112371]
MPLMLKPRKFAIFTLPHSDVAISIFNSMSRTSLIFVRVRARASTRWSSGSALFLASWAVLMGPVPYARHLTSGPRLPFTAAYFTSIALTLYFAVGLHSTILTLISSVCQLVALIWYLVSYFPMGNTGLRMVARVGTGRVAAWMSD